MERSFVHPKKHVFGRNLFTKLSPYLFSVPNWLYGAFGGKIVPDENFAQFCLRSPLKFVFPKNTFSIWIFVLNRTSPIFLAKQTRWSDCGQKCPGAKCLGLIGYMVHSEAICSGRKLCSILPQKPSRIRFLQKHVFGKNFCTKSHLTYFMGQTD